MELLTNVSHDLKTPLTSIINYADLLCAEPLEGAAADYAKVIQRKADRLKHMVQDVFDLSKAASALYMSQSTLSYRLSMLENELNATLFIRRKGQRTLELTPYGYDFIHIAERWMALWSETQSLHTIHGSRTVYLGAVASLIQYLFPALLRRVAQEHREALAKYRAEYMALRSAYTTDYRGDPAYECGDYLLLQTNFAVGSMALLLKNTITYNGALRGEAVLKRVTSLTQKYYTGEIYAGDTIGVM